ncbi:hypothetical protein K2X33_00290 [bacterium]|nr:hypothetical protein [bacterium]
MELLNRLKSWAAFLKQTRTFFEQKGYTEVTTETLVPAGAFEASLDPICASVGEERFELPTSPEIEMKRWLAEVHAPIYQIARSYRDDPDSPIHRREFLMLEYYATGPDAYETVLAQTLEFIEAQTGTLPWQRQSIPRIFAKWGLKLDELSETQAFREAIEKKGLARCSADDSWNDLFFRVLLDNWENTLDPARPTVVEDYPACVSPLSSPNPNQPFYARRFEIYWHGMELCNGCEELTDPRALHRSWEYQGAERALRQAQPHPYPERLIQAAHKGLPPCAGVAVGLERLFLACQQAQGLAQPGEPIGLFPPV